MPPPANPFNFDQPWFSQPYQPITYEDEPQTPRQANEQLAWFASLSGQDPQTFLDQQATTQANDLAYQQWLAAQGGTSGAGVTRALWDQQQQLGRQVGEIGNLTSGANSSIDRYQSQLEGIAAASRADAARMQQNNVALNQRNWDSVNLANGSDAQALTDYRNGIAAQTNWDLANYQNLANAANRPMQMTMSPYVGGASSSAADISRQIGAYNQLQGIAGGSLDQTSQAARAYANAADVAAQKGAAAQLRAAGNGALDVNAATIGGMPELYSVWQGSMDIKPGQGDPEAYAAAVDARNTFKERSNVEVTAQERLMYELALQKQEQDERGVREALQADARQRGVSGYGAEIARSGIAAQQTSRNRMLADMAAGANAISRAQQNLQDYGATSLAMNAAGNDLAMNNVANRLTALGQYNSVSANVAVSNNDRRLNAQQAAYAAYSDIRAQGFSEEYARGVAADNMANANADRRLGGAIGAANQSNAIRSANDSMSQFNAVQRQNYQMESDRFAANRQDAQFGRAVALSQQGNVVSGNFGQNNTNLFNGTTGINDRTFNRTQGGIGTEIGLDGRVQNQANFAAGLGTQAAGQGISNTQTKLGNSFTPINAQQQRTQQRVNAATIIRDDARGVQAAREARAANGGGMNPMGYTPMQTPQYVSPYYNPALTREQADAEANMSVRPA